MTEQTDVHDQDKIFHNHADLAGASKHAATISALCHRIDRGIVPMSGEPTGTVTFLEILGKTYALTAAHVIDELDSVARNHGMPRGNYLLPKDPTVQMIGPFIRVPKDPAARTFPDVCIRPVPSELPKRIGKVAFVVKEEGTTPSAISHGVAVGYPTSSKHDQVDPRGTYVAMPSVHAVAEFTGKSADQIIFRSELKDWPVTGSLSGMSGGPVFWSDEHNYGLAGIVIEAIDAAPGESFFNFPMVQFTANLVSYDILLRWADHADSNWDRELDQLAEDRKAFRREQNA